MQAGHCQGSRTRTEWQPHVGSADVDTTAATSAAHSRAVNGSAAGCCHAAAHLWHQVLICSKQSGGTALVGGSPGSSGTLCAARRGGEEGRAGLPRPLWAQPEPSHHEQGHRCSSNCRPPRCTPSPHAAARHARVPAAHPPPRGAPCLMRRAEAPELQPALPPLIPGACRAPPRACRRSVARGHRRCVG